jgi:hypothetical protein
MVDNIIPQGWTTEAPQNTSALPKGWSLTDPSARTSKPKEKEAWYQDFGEGVGLSGIETAYGLKSLFTDLSPEENARLKDWRDDAGESGWGTAGQVVGDIAQMALPGAAGIKALKVGNSVLKGALAAGVLGGIQAPDENESRWSNAALSSGSALVGGGLLKGLGKAVTGFSKTPAGIEAAKQGIYLTPGKATDSGLVRAAEFGMRIVPGTSKGTLALQEQGVKSWLMNTANKVAKPLGMKLDDLGEDSMKALQKQFKSAYTDAWAQATNMVGPDKITKFNKLVSPEIKFMEDAPKKAVAKILSRLKELKGSKDPKGLRALDKLIKDNIGKYSQDGDLLKMFKGMKDVLRENMGGTSSASLQKLDSLYPGYKTLTTAAHNAYGGGSGLTLDILKNASKQVGTKGTQAAFGKAPLQAEIQLGIDTIGQQTPNILFDVIKGLAQNAPSPTGAMKGFGHVIMGETGAQQAIKGAVKRSGIDKAVAKFGNILNVNPATITAGMEQ